MRPAVMHKHRSEDADPVLPENYLCGNRGPQHDKCVAAHQLKKKHYDIYRDDERSYDRQSRPDVAKRN